MPPPLTPVPMEPLPVVLDEPEWTDEQVEEDATAQAYYADTGHSFHDPEVAASIMNELLRRGLLRPPWIPQRAALRLAPRRARAVGRRRTRRVSGSRRARARSPGRQADDPELTAARSGASA